MRRQSRTRRPTGTLSYGWTQPTEGWHGTKYLKVASLAAVPKDPTWEQVRVVHDATHGVEVNHHIMVVDRMRFPLFDDLESAILNFWTKAILGDWPWRMANDFKGAHRLIPIHPSDWGKQASDWKIQIRFTSIASAPLASLLRRSGGRDWPVPCRGWCGGSCPRILYADGGLALTSGPQHRRAMLALLLFLDCSWGPSGLVQDQGRSTGGVACMPGGREAPASRHLFQKDRMASGLDRGCIGQEVSAG